MAVSLLPAPPLRELWHRALKPGDRFDDFMAAHQQSFIHVLLIAGAAASGLTLPLEFIA